MVAKAVAYTPLITGVPNYTTDTKPPVTVIPTDREFFLKSAVYNSADGSIHNVLFYTIPLGQTLFLEQVAITGTTIDSVAAANGGFVRVVALSQYIGGIELVSGSSSTMVNHYPTPLKLTEGQTIYLLYYQPTATKDLDFMIILSGYLLSNF
jgi:hypothetical protein